MELSDKKKDMADGVSIVVVTYNGAGRIEETLKHIAGQSGLNFDIELLVIDNCSTDDTASKAKELWKEYGKPFTLKVIAEPRQGTMYARKRGIDESSYRYILYCDDDNWLSPDYVSVAYHIIKSSSEIAAVGGKGVAYYKQGIEVPGWMHLYEKNLGTGPQGTDGDTTYAKGCLYTAGAILDKLWIEKLYSRGFKSILKGRDGNSLVAGEDTELTYALKLIGGRLYYSSEMTFKHYIPENRVQWDYIKKLWYSFGVSDFIISPYPQHFSKRPVSNVRFLAGRLKDIFLLLFKKMIFGHKVGDKRILLLERQKGNLYSYFKYRANFKACQNIVKELDSFAC